MVGSFWQHRSRLVLGFALIAGIRFGVLWLGRDSLSMDPDAYLALANTWRETGTFGRIDAQGTPVPTAYRPPLYPWVISWFPAPSDRVANPWWIMGLHGTLGIATCAATLAIGKRLGLPPLACWFAVFWVACDPILLRQSTLIMTETLATFLGAILWWWWLRDATVPRDRWSGHPLLLGIGMGLAVLCRPTALAWIVLWWSLALIEKRWRWVATCVLGMSFAMVPWGVRNAILIGEPIATTTHGGYTLYLANNPVLYRHWQSSVSREWDEEAFHARWRVERSQSANLDELTSDRLAQGLAWSTIRSSPGTFLQGCAIRTGWLWALWPSHRQASTATQIAIAIWYAIVFFLAIAGWVHLMRSGVAVRFWVPGLLLVASLTLVHSVYWSNMRMRAPAVPILALLSGCGLLRCSPAREVNERKSVDG